MPKFNKSEIRPPFDYVRSILSEIGVNHQTRLTKGGWPYLTFAHPQNGGRISFQFRSPKRDLPARIVVFKPGKEQGTQKKLYFNDMSGFLAFLGLSAEKIEELRQEQISKKEEKSMDHNGWTYNGDVGIRHGGYYWRADSNDQNTIYVVRVTPLSDAGGPDNQFRIETGQVDLSLEDQLTRAREISGIDPENANLDTDVDAMISAFGLGDYDESWVLQIGPDDELWDGHGKREEPAQRLPEDSSLRDWIKAEYLHPEPEQKPTM